MARNSGPTQRGLLGSGAGKGDADRSPGWRDHYDEIDWSGSQTGFEQVGSHKQVKRYGVREPAKLDTIHGRLK